MKIAIPENVMTALEILGKNGYSAYAVGGCVRDSLLGNKPDDWDICTSALPEQTAECFAGYRVIPTGVKHGTITVIIGKPLEITTFRIDGDYLDNRRPSEVSFTRKLEDDLCRRDFTVNAMALSASGEITDLYGGRKDLEAKLIRCVGCAETRFEEDALRIMRALRFASVLGFEIESETAKAIHSKKHLLRNIAAERIVKEFTKLLCGGCTEILREYADVIKIFLPLGDFAEDTLSFIKKSPADPLLKLSILLAKSAPEEAEKMLRELKYDNRTLKHVTLMLGTKKMALSNSIPQVKRLINRFGEEAVSVADFHLHTGKITPEIHKSITETIDGIIANGECCTLSKLAVKGSDIAALGIFPQNKIGKVLFSLLEKVMDGECENDKNSLIKLAENLNY